MSVALWQQPQPDRAELQQAVRRLTRTVDHLLDATRLESGLLQPVREWCEPGELVREAVALVRIKGKRGSKSTSPKDLAHDFSGRAPDSTSVRRVTLERRRSRQKRSTDRSERGARRFHARDFPWPITAQVLRPAKKTKSSKNSIAVRHAPRRSRPWSFHRPPTGRGALPARSSRKIEKTAARAFPFAFPSANRCSFRLKRPHETGRVDHR